MKVICDKVKECEKILCPHKKQHIEYIIGDTEIEFPCIKDGAECIEVKEDK